MTDPTPPRPVPGPPRPGPGGGPAPVPTGAVPAGAPPAGTSAADGGAPLADLAHRPVAEHVAVFEAEHARLQRELGTIDQL
ncbi:hypothetical protein SAMN05660209_04839 [Geodermatophilus africanus]|uniref:Uncharacterized protein n=1 Tax=Geodermatophilus africanus TaxID=1137993 RepID=A0A1H3QN16_9ACTN|nr:hypothetical protein SAMN05660209_04839 [Geodermatophilus africanus]